ncbi:MAG: Gfo/Idh/MocA family oxidoreductase [Oscillospiraceae bacterium]|nr:Gfo/Idh/MocA family oxidoreductase [Oscillospiraceae bacterium]
MEKEILGVGIIGCGTFCVEYLKTLGPVYKNVKVVACSDIDMNKANEIAKEWGVPHPCTTDELLADPEVDIAVIVTGPGSHYPLTMQALKAGKHVYCEKPMAMTFEQANEIVALAEEKGLFVANAPDTFLDVGQQMVRKIIDEGAIGKVTGMMINFIGPGVDWWHPTADFYYKKGGGPVMDMGPYYLSALVSILGPIDEIFCYQNRALDQREIQDHITSVEVDTNCCGVVKMKNGVIGNINLSFDILHSRAPHFEIYGTDACLICPDPNNYSDGIHIIKREDLKNKVSVMENFWDRIDYIDSPQPMELYNEVKTPTPIGEHHRGMGVNDMVECILHGAKPRCSMYMSRHVTEAICGFDISAKTGLPYKMTTTCERPACTLE